MGIYRTSGLCRTSDLSEALKMNFCVLVLLELDKSWVSTISALSHFDTASSWQLFSSLLLLQSIMIRKRKTIKDSIFAGFPTISVLKVLQCAMESL